MPILLSLPDYNLENLFDPFDDSLKMDEDFTPTGFKYWTYKKMLRKLRNTTKTLIALGGWELPAIIGLCEVENRFVLNKLVFETPLKNAGYRVIHFESPDKRGIDVAMIYRPDKFYPVSSTPLNIRFPFAPLSKTRDILYVKGLILGKDTLHIFINHWPSRYGGYLNTTSKRYFVGALLKKHTDSIMNINPDANIIIMGDLNDDPEDISITEGLAVKGDTIGLEQGELVNLMTISESKFYEGTLKHLDTWHTFDQIIVSGALLKASNNLTIKSFDCIFSAGFLLVPDPTNLGTKLNRTYLGPRYIGAFSDHFPVFVDILRQ